MVFSSSRPSTFLRLRARRSVAAGLALVGVTLAFAPRGHAQEAAQPAPAAQQDRLSPASVAAGAAPYQLEVPSNDPLTLRDNGWDLQWNARLGLGFGSTMGTMPHRFIFETIARAEALFGRKGDEHPRLGPGIELRSNTYKSWEMGGTLATTLPVFRGFPIFLSAGAGYAFRRSSLGGNGGYFDGTFAWGYRSYNHKNRYQVAVQAYVTTRVHTNDISAYEITGGITFDLALMFGVPGLFVATMAEGDPHRFEGVPRDESWRQAPPPQRAPGFDPASRAAEEPEGDGSGDDAAEPAPSSDAGDSATGSEAPPAAD